MLRQRILVWVIGLALIIAIIWFGGRWGFTFLVAVIAILGSLEFYRMANQSKIQPLTYFGIVWALLLVLSPHLDDYLGKKLNLLPTNISTMSLLITLAMLTSIIWLLFRLPREQAFNNWAWTMAGILYIGWMLSYWVDLRNLEAGTRWVLWGLLTIVANDTGAFLVGRTWGKHHLAPAISPSKTWEGAIGGFLAAIAASLLVGKLCSLPLDYLQMVLLGCVISIFAQLGDLVESLFKRNVGVKDSGNLLPGHGGILDRTDSLIFTGVVVYYCVVFATLWSTL